MTSTRLVNGNRKEPTQVSGPIAEFQIGVADLRRGLQAVAPHVHPDPDYPGQWRTRVELGPEVVLLAADNFTAAMYSTSADHVRQLGLDYFDLTPPDVAKILAVFKAGKDEDADYPESVLQFDVDEKLIKIRDISGMFAGHELELPHQLSNEFPNVARVFRTRLDHGPRTDEDNTIQVNPKMWGRFAKSGQIMGSQLTVDTTATPYLVTCSDVFVGALMPSRVTDEIRSDLRDRLRRWTGTTIRLAGAAAGRVAEAEQISERVAAAIRAVGVRQAATIVGVAEALSVGRNEAVDLLEQLAGAGLLERKGKRYRVMFGPDEVDQVIAAWGEDPLPDPTPPDVEGQGADVAAVEEVPGDDETSSAATDGQVVSHAPEASPFSDVPAPVSPFKDSDGNEWPTAPASPFDAGPGDLPPF